MAGVPVEKFEKETTVEKVSEDVATFLRGTVIALLFEQGGGLSIFVHPLEPLHAEGTA